MTSVTTHQTVNNQVAISCIYPVIEEIDGGRILTGRQYEAPLRVSPDLAEVIKIAKDVFDRVSELKIQSDNFPTRFREPQEIDDEEINELAKKVKVFRDNGNKIRSIPGSFEETTRKSMEERVGNCYELAHIALLLAPSSLDRHKVTIIKKEGVGDHVFCVFHPRGRERLQVICDVWAGLVCPYNMGLRHVYHYLDCVDLSCFVNGEEIVAPYPLIAPFNEQVDSIEWCRVEDLDAGKMFSIPSRDALWKWVAGLRQDKTLPSNWQDRIKDWIEKNPNYQNRHGITSADLEKCLSAERR
jgi:hypothetical protein